MISRAICRTENSAIQQKFLAASKSPVCKPAPVCAFLFSSFNIKRLFYSVGFLLNFTAGLLSVVGLAKSPKPSPILSDFLSCDTRIYLVVLHHDDSGVRRNDFRRHFAVTRWDPGFLTYNRDVLSPLKRYKIDHRGYTTRRLTSALLRLKMGNAGGRIPLPSIHALETIVSIPEHVVVRQPAPMPHYRPNMDGVTQKALIALDPPARGPRSGQPTSTFHVTAQTPWRSMSLALEVAIPKSHVTRPHSRPA